MVFGDCMIHNKEQLNRIITISYKHKLSHVASCITSLIIINEIYSSLREGEKFVNSAGHSHLAHLVVKESRGMIDNAENQLLAHGIHCDRAAGCDVSTGSLGMGLPIAVGMALADRNKNVYCLVSDGELSEGGIWEALRIIEEHKLSNVKLYINANQWAAYKRVDVSSYKKLLIQYEHLDVNIILTDVADFPFLQGQSGHYKILDDEMYKQALEILA